MSANRAKDEIVHASPSTPAGRRLGDRLLQGASPAALSSGGSGHLLQGGKPDMNVGQPSEARFGRLGAEGSLRIAQLAAQRPRAVMQPDGLPQFGFELGGDALWRQEASIAGAQLAPQPPPAGIEVRGEARRPPPLPPRPEGGIGGEGARRGPGGGVGGGEARQR